MNGLSDKYAIVGTGKSRLGQVGANSLSLLEEAIKNALDEAGLTNKDVDGVVVRGADDIYSHHQLMAAAAGHRRELQHQPRQRRRQPDPVDHPRRDGDRMPASPPRLSAATAATAGAAPTTRAAPDLRRTT